MIMKGFRVKCNDVIYYATLPLPIISVEVSNKSSRFRLNISGMDKSGLSYQWHSAPLREGDTVEITFGDFDRTTPPAKIFDITDINVQNELMLQEYFELKEELNAEGQI